MVAVLGKRLLADAVRRPGGCVGSADPDRHRSYTIIGVAPPGFVGISDEAPPAMFIPITAYAGTFRGGPAQANYYTRYNWGWMNVLARRKPGVSVAEASADLSRAYVQSWNYEVSQGWHTPPRRSPIRRGSPVRCRPSGGPQQSKVTKVAAWVSAVAVIVPAHCMRERGQLVAGPIGSPPPRDRRAAGAGCEPAPVGAPAIDRKPAARWLRWTGRSAAGTLGRSSTPSLVHAELSQSPRLLPTAGPLALRWPWSSLPVS